MIKGSFYDSLGATMTINCMINAILEEYVTSHNHHSRTDQCFKTAPGCAATTLCVKNIFLYCIDVW
jgi:hypothetical protein